MKKLLTILMLICAFQIYAYEPMTYEQADTYLGSITYDQVVELVIDYDYIEHSKPSIVIPKISCVLFDEDLLLAYNAPIEVGVSSFTWEIPVPDQTVYNFITERESTWKYWLAGGIGAICGIGLGVLVGVIL
jgi:hypothetical protein